MTTDSSAFPPEHRDLLESLRQHRRFLRFTVQGLTDEQARLRPTVSQLSLAALIKHVTATEKVWIDFIHEGAAAFGPHEARWDEQWTVHPDETLDVLLARYDEIAARTDDLVAGGLDLDITHRLPDAPWFPPDGTRSARRVLIHLVAETAQHAGHADILREAIDGQKTMG